MNHVHLTVDDVPGARALLERHFGLRLQGEGHKNRATLLDDEGLVLTLIGVGSANTVTYPPTFHLGFILPGREDVDALHKRLTDDGVAADAPKEQHGAWAFAVQAPGGFRIVIRG